MRFVSALAEINNESACKKAQAASLGSRRKKWRNSIYLLKKRHYRWKYKFMKSEAIQFYACRTQFY